MVCSSWTRRAVRDGRQPHVAVAVVGDLADAALELDEVLARGRPPADVEERRDGVGIPSARTSRGVVAATGPSSKVSA